VNFREEYTVGQPVSPASERHCDAGGDKVSFVEGLSEGTGFPGINYLARGLRDALKRLL
jgi:hypothetical protein